jgi:DNA-binding NarL/FixJ family response regulator
MLRTLALISTHLFQQEQVSFLRSVPGLEVLPPVCSPQEFWSAACRLRPDLAILDESLFLDPNLATLHQLKAQFPAMFCLVIAGRTQQIAPAIAAGADRVLLRGFSAREFFQAVAALQSPHPPSTPDEA